MFSHFLFGGAHDAEFKKLLDKGRLQTARKLKNDHNVNVNLTDKNGNTLFALAVKKGKEGLVKSLINDSDVHVNKKNVNGDTALIIAVKSDNLEMVQILLEYRRIKTNIKNNAGLTALDVARNKNKNHPTSDQLRIMELLKSRSSQSSASRSSKQPSASRSSKQSSASRSSKQSSSTSTNSPHLVNINSDTPLIRYAKQNDLENVQLLLQSPTTNVNVTNNQGKTALDVAVENQNTEMVRILLDAM